MQTTTPAAPATTAPMPLSQRIGTARFEALVETRIRGDEDQTLNGSVSLLLAEHLAALRDAGVVRPLDQVPNRSIPVVHEWNGMWEDHMWASRGDSVRRVADRFAWQLVLVAAFRIAREHGHDSPAERRHRISEALSAMDAGDVPFRRIPSQDRDLVTGERLAYEMRGWNLVVGRPPQRGEDRIVQIDDAPAPAVHAVEIDTPSGALLLADWFRPPGFTDLVDEGNPWRGGSVAEEEAEAERYVRDFGFVSMSSAYRSLTVIRRNGIVAVGHHDEDGPHRLPRGFRRVARRTIDLRRVTLCDETGLMNLLARIHPRGQAERMVRELVASGDVVRIEVNGSRQRVVGSGRGHVGDLLPDGHRLKTPGWDAVLHVEPVPIGGPAA